MQSRGSLTATTNALGQAVFANLTDTALGSHTLKASVKGLTTVSSSSFTVTMA